MRRNCKDRRHKPASALRGKIWTLSPTAFSHCCASPLLSYQVVLLHSLAIALRLRSQTFRAASSKSSHLPQGDVSCHLIHSVSLSRTQVLFALQIRTPASGLVKDFSSFSSTQVSHFTQCSRYLRVTHSSIFSHQGSKKSVFALLLSTPSLSTLQVSGSSVPSRPLRVHKHLRFAAMTLSLVRGCDAV